MKALSAAKEIELLYQSIMEKKVIEVTQDEYNFAFAYYLLIRLKGE